MHPAGHSSIACSQCIIRLSAQMYFIKLFSYHSVFGNSSICSRIPCQSRTGLSIARHFKSSKSSLLDVQDWLSAARTGHFEPRSRSVGSRPSNLPMSEACMSRQDWIQAGTSSPSVRAERTSNMHRLYVITAPKKTPTKQGCVLVPLASSSCHVSTSGTKSSLDKLTSSHLSMLELSTSKRHTFQSNRPPSLPPSVTKMQSKSGKFGSHLGVISCMSHSAAARLRLSRDVLSKSLILAGPTWEPCHPCEKSMRTPAIALQRRYSSA
mmetsp:Transcript_51574/g.122689  ORF Transcript_51574/g.122689 Transcript_51574/m.122689 type:complete len:266 (-) Transcript_51574:69-866(-)